jgi:hypothetical protein
MRIVVLPGDGIGPEITAVTLNVLRVASERFQLDVRLDPHPIGYDSLRQFGTTVKPGLLEAARAADGLILGPTATFEFKDENSGEINPSKYFRKNLDLFANLRPARSYSGLRNRFGQFDLVVVREKIPKASIPTATWSRATANCWSRPMLRSRSVVSRGCAASGSRWPPANWRCAAASISPSSTRLTC